MRYHIFFRTGDKLDWTRLIQGEHLAIYDQPEVNKAIDYMVANPEIVGLAIQLGTQQFDILRVPNGTACLTAFQR
jgi:hypothetical protein